MENQNERPTYYGEVNNNPPKQITLEDVEKVGELFVNFMKIEYDNLKESYHKNPKYKEIMDLPSYCFTMFIIAIKSYNELNPENAKPV